MTASAPVSELPGTPSEIEDFRTYLVPLSQLKAYYDPDNSNVLDDGAMQRLTMSISEHGFRQPVLVNVAYDPPRLVGGEHRCEAALRCHMLAAPVWYVRMGPAQHAATALALNAQFGHDDEAKLRSRLISLRDAGYDLDLTALPPFEIETALAAMPDGLPDGLPEPPESLREDSRFTVSYGPGDKAALCRFLDRPELPEKKTLGVLVMDRIRHLALYGGDDDE